MMSPGYLVPQSKGGFKDQWGHDKRHIARLKWFHWHNLAPFQHQDDSLLKSGLGKSFMILKGII